MPDWRDRHVWAASITSVGADALYAEYGSKAWKSSFVDSLTRRGTRRNLS